MTRVAVVGFGPHGVAAAAALAARGARVIVVDPAEAPLAAWSRRAAGIGMDRMRSPWVHHVEVDPMALIRFGGADPPWAGSTPSVADFEAHAVSVAALCPLQHIRDRVIGLHRDDGPVAVIGSGYTATTAARALLRAGCTVDLFAPSGLYAVPDDVDPGWFGPKNLTGYQKLPATERVRPLREARRGTTPPGLLAWLQDPGRSRRLSVVCERVRAVCHHHGVLTVHTRTERTGYVAAYAAAGYAVDVDNIAWLCPWVKHRQSGWPVLDDFLQAAPGLHLLGPLAELELGPAGRNLWGAQRAAQRLVAALA